MAAFQTALTDLVTPATNLVGAIVGILVVGLGARYAWKTIRGVA